MSGEQEVRLGGGGGSGRNHGDDDGVNTENLNGALAEAAAFNVASERASKYADDSGVTPRNTLEAIANTGGQ